MPEPTISVIIPTYNEADTIAATIDLVRQRSVSDHIAEIIVADGQSRDATPELAEKAGARVISIPKRSRGGDMNSGAEIAGGDILYFLHSDTLPPPGFSQKIIDAYKTGYCSGGFMFKFDESSFLLKLCQRVVHTFDDMRFGDQSLFVDRKLFQDVGGYDADMILFEDVNIVRRLKENSEFTIIKDPVTTSARKFRDNGTGRLLVKYLFLYLAYAAGLSQERLVDLYRRLVKQDKV